MIDDDLDNNPALALLEAAWATGRSAASVSTRRIRLRKGLAA